MMWSFTLLLANFAFSVISTQETCDKDSCQSYFNDVEWSGTIQDLDKWLENQKSRKTVTFCNADSKIAANSKNLRQFSPISEPFQCPEIGSLVDFQGNLKNNLPHGKGRFHVLKLPKKQPPNSNCYELLNIIGSLHGKFQNGKLNGRGEIVYEDDVTILEGNFFKGILNGKVRLFTNQDWLLFVGQFEAGLPHGPFWIFSRFYNQFIFMHFEHGKIFEEEVILYSPEEKKLLKGKMVENSFLKDAKEVKISKIGQYNCLQVIKTEEIEGHQTKQEDLIRLPVKIFSSIKDQRILIRPGKLLYYNRVAKTGSQSFTRLLFEMGKKHGYLMKSIIMESGEKVCDSDNLIGKFEAIDTVMKWHNPIALVRHYSFINFHEYGYQWRPDWFSMVREPVEKVISWFYYVRAPWRVEERMKNEKGYEKPSEEFLNKNFEFCFKNGDPECTYEQFSDVEDDPGDHRSQIVQFCGHDPVCRRFNDPIALKMAKENVEKYYKVVGVTEHFNMTLKVLEHFMPEYFKGAFLKYHEDKGVQSFQFKNPNKAKVSDEIKNEMRKYFKYELEFYDFLKQRLLSQYEQIPEDQKLVEN